MGTYFGSGSLFLTRRTPAKEPGQPTKLRGLKNRRGILQRMRPGLLEVKVGTVSEVSLEIAQRPNFIFCTGSADPFIAGSADRRFWAVAPNACGEPGGTNQSGANGA